MRHVLPALAAAALALAACAPTYEIGAPASTVSPGPVALPEGTARSPADFRRVAARVEPMAERLCRETAAGAPGGYCDFAIALEDDPRMPPNAFQTRSGGRPVVVVSASLLGQMLTDDEIAFVLSHEAAHHIADHLSKQQQSQMLGALIVGGLASASAGAAGLTDQDLRDAMDIGAYVGGRAYSQSYELEADWVGAFIAAGAGYDPERGAAVFGRPALAGAGGPVLLSTHPASPQRQATVSAAAAEIHRQRAAGLDPRPAQAGRRWF